MKLKIIEIMKRLIFLLLLTPSILWAQSKDPLHPVPQNIKAKMVSANIAEITWQAPDTVYNTVFYEDFESGTIPDSWTLHDLDADTNTWEMHPADWSDAHGGSYSVASYSWFNGDSLYPDNWLVTPAITIPENGELRYFVAAISENYSAEHYQVKLSTNGTDPENFSETLLDETLPEDNDQWQQKNIGLTNWAGQEVHIAFIHNEISGMFALKLDDISVNQTEETKNPNISAYNIYKKYEDETAEMVDQTDNNSFTYYDTLAEEGEYTYAVSAAYSDGAESLQNFSNVVTYTNWLPPVQGFNASISGETVSLSWDNASPQNKLVMNEGFENFSNLTKWQIKDFDGDGATWEKHTASEAYQGEQSIASYSWFNGQTLYPNNWLISTKLPLLYADSLALSWAVSGIDATYTQEYYQVRVSDTENDTSNFDIEFEETLPEQDNQWKTRSISLNGYAGDSICLAFVHQQISDIFALKIDAVQLKTFNPVLGFKIYRKAPDENNMQLIDSLAQDIFSYENPVSDTGNYQYYMSAVYKNGGEGSKTASETIHYNSIKKTNPVSVNLYPNPVNSGKIFIKSDNPIHQAVIFNMKGQMVFQKNSLNREKITLTPNLKAGQYLLKINSGNNEISRTLIVK